MKTECYLQDWHGWCHDNKHLDLILMGYGEDHRVCRVAITEASDEKSADAWAWWDAKDEEFQMVWPEKFMVEMCFPYGAEAEEERGRGRLLPVCIEVLETVHEPKAESKKISKGG